MAVQDKMGKVHHSASRARLSDDMAEAKISKPNAEHRTPQSGVSGQSQDVSNMKIKDVVAKHGSAHEIHIKHDHGAGQHHVTSHHKGGHHKSMHASADDAHLHAAQAAGLNTPDEAEEAEPYAGNESPEEEAAEEKEGGGIPGMG